MEKIKKQVLYFVSDEGIFIDSVRGWYIINPCQRNDDDNDDKTETRPLSQTQARSRAEVFSIGYGYFPSGRSISKRDWVFAVVGYFLTGRIYCLVLWNQFH